MKIVVKIFLVLIFCVTKIFSQGSAGSNANYEFRSLIDMQSAGVLKKGDVGVSFYAMPNGVLISNIEAGIFDNFNIGLSYGGSNIIGTGNPEFYKLPGIQLKFRIFNESFFFPAVALGFNSQGKGDYIDSLSRYEIKSPGFYTAFSKNFEWLGFLSIHGCLNYSFENKDDDNFNFSFGIEKTINEHLSFFIEYDFALNDNNQNSFGIGNGYLNISFDWSIIHGITVGIDIRNILKNNKFNSYRADRAIYAEFIQTIF